MNERIRELAKQATETVDVSEKLGMPGTDLVFNKEKFAELIVRECLGLLGSESEYGKNHIKKHFGVEE